MAEDERSKERTSTRWIEPRVSPLPVLSFGMRFGGAKRIVSLGMVGERCCFVTSARMAIGLALKSEGVGSDDAVLVPAFHCASLVAPIEHVGAQVIFYPVNEDLSVNIESIRALINDRVRMIVVVHYFGMLQDLRPIRGLCDELAICLLEDCAHAPIGERNGQPVGSVGDYAVFSLMKFFPVFDGGGLRWKVDVNDPVLTSGGLSYEIRAAVDAIEKAVRYGRLRPFNWFVKPLLVFKTFVRKNVKRWHDSHHVFREAPGASHGGSAFDPAWMNIRMARFSIWLYRGIDKRAIADRRRKNYLSLVQGICNLPGVKVLFPDLPQDTVPYVVPVIFDRPHEVFRHLKHSGVPLYRWEDMRVTSCVVSERYRNCLFQLPCHQELRKSEINWILESVRNAVMDSQIGHDACGNEAVES